MLRAPTIPFSTQYVTRSDHTFQPQNSTPASGTRLNATQRDRDRRRPGAIHPEEPFHCREAYPVPGRSRAVAPAVHSEPMDDERWEPGMPVLDRQPPPEPARPRAYPTTNLPPSLQGLPPRSVPETAPTPLQRHYINLSVIALIAGAVAITALELGMPLGSPLVKLCVLIAAPIIVLTTADAARPDLAVGLGLDAGRPRQGPVPPRLAGVGWGVHRRDGRCRRARPDRLIT